MVRFSIYGKTFKELTEKVMVAVNKKAVVSSLQRVYFRVENGVLHVFATTMEQYIDVENRDVYQCEDGEFAMDLEEIKLISKMTDNIEFVETTEQEDNRKATVKCGKKQITVSIYDNYDKLCMPIMEDTEHISNHHETWLLETLVNLEKFTTDDNNKVMQCINLNTENMRAEALDGHRIATRKIDGIVNTQTDNLLIHKMCVPVLKKVLNKKWNTLVSIDRDDKFVRIEGEGFTYIQRQVDGQYFKVSGLLDGVGSDYEFTVDRKNLLEVTKYAADIIGKEQKPLIFHSENNNVYTYCVVPKYELCDELETDNVRMNDELFIGFNPNFFVEALSVAESDDVRCVGLNAKTPMLMESNDYSFLILPINIMSNSELEMNIRQNIERVA